MQILELGEGPPELSYDLEWLTVLRLTDHLTSVASTAQYMPGPGCNQRRVQSGSVGFRRKLFDCGPDL